MMFDGFDTIWRIDPSDRIPHAITYAREHRKRTVSFTKMLSGGYGYSLITVRSLITTRKRMS